MAKHKSKPGFTLIELLVVISIIGILVAVGTISYQRAIKLARDNKRKTDLEQIRQSLETYRSENGFYPLTETWRVDLVPNFMSSLPTDPKEGDYTYLSLNEPFSTSYALCATLENTPDSIPTNCSTVNCGAEVCNYEVTNP